MDPITVGREFGHVPGHQFLDIEIEVTGKVATLTIVWGSAQGRDEEHGREEYTRRGLDPEGAIEAVRDAALENQDDAESRRYIEQAASRALRQFGCG